MKLSFLFFVACVSLSSCYYEDIERAPDLSACAGTDLIISAAAQNASGCTSADGTITATATGGSGDYTFSRDGGDTKTASGIFENLAGGSYLIIVYDGSQCTDSLQVNVATSGTAFQANLASSSPDTECLVDNGAVELSATGGSGAYTFQLNGETNSTGKFTGLAGGTYMVAVSDGSCSVNVSATVPSESTVSYKLDIAPILTAKCNDSRCHGDNSAQTHLTSYEIVKANAADIKLRTANGNMPKAPMPGGDLTAEEIQMIACWVDSGALNN